MVTDDDDEDDDFAGGREENIVSFTSHTWQTLETALEIKLVSPYFL